MPVIFCRTHPLVLCIETVGPVCLSLLLILPVIYMLILLVQTFGWLSLKDGKGWYKECKIPSLPCNRHRSIFKIAILPLSVTLLIVSFCTFNSFLFFSFFYLDGFFSRQKTYLVFTHYIQIRSMLCFKLI